MFGSGACEKGAGGPLGFAPPWLQHLKGMHGGGNCGPAAILADLNLTDQQLERAAELKLEGLAQCAQFKVTLAPLVKQIASELTANSINKAKVAEIAQQIKAQKSQMGDSMLERILSFAELLTADQRKKLKITAIKRFLGLDFIDQHKE